MQLRASTPKPAVGRRSLRAGAIRAAILALALLGAGAGGALPGGALLADAAFAGQWIQESCINPNNTPAPNQGWSSFITGTPSDGSENDTNCSPTTPMEVLLQSEDSAPVGSAETIQYSPPVGSTLAGGWLRASLAVSGYLAYATGQVSILTPTDADDASDTIFECASSITPCSSAAGSNYTGIINLPASRGGDLYLTADCGGTSGQDCNSSTLAYIKMDYAELLLSNTSSPAASGFSGSLLTPNAHGTADILFTATDPDGPGVYQVTIDIDGNTIYQATPDANDGECDPVGNDSTDDALEFDWQQPCPQTETDDIPIDTTAFTDGQHDLKVIVTDAAQNTSTVLDQTITTLNSPPATPTPSTPAPGATPVTPSGYRLSLDPAAKSLVHGVTRPYTHSAMRLAGTLHTPSGAAAPNVPVTLWVRPANGGTFTKLRQTITSRSGAWTLAAPPGASRLLRITDEASTQPGLAINVREAVTPTLTLKVVTPGNRELVFTGQLGIKPLGDPRPLVLIETPGPDGWEAVGRPIRVGPHGDFHYVYRTSAATLDRSFNFRAITPATALWQPAESPVRVAVVR